MYLHIGQDTVLREQDIIGIFDMDNTTVSRITRDFLNRAEREGRVSYVNYELPKSFVVCRAPDDRGHTVHIAQMAPRTLYKRAQMLQQSTDR